MQSKLRKSEKASLPKRRFALTAISTLLVLLSFLHAGDSASGQIPSARVDLSQAVIVTATSIPVQEEKAVTMLIEEVEKRTQIHLERVTAIPAGTTRPIIAIGQSQNFRTLAATLASQLSGGSVTPEGYRIRVDASKSPATVMVAGNDLRGVLFGVGRLLRSLQFGKGSLSVSSDLRVEASPATPLRGHQLGYRPKTNSYDAWTVAMWEQYIRDLVVFGVNAIELIPPRSDDDDDSPHFPLPKIEMMVEMSRICDEYGLDVWIWYPAMDEDYADPQTVEFALKEWGEVFGTPARQCCVRSRRRSWPHASEAAHGPARKADRRPADATIRRPRCGCRRRASIESGWTSSTTSSALISPNG